MSLEGDDPSAPLSTRPNRGVGPDVDQAHGLNPADMHDSVQIQSWVTHILCPFLRGLYELTEFGIRSQRKT